MNVLLVNASTEAGKDLENRRFENHWSSWSSSDYSDSDF